MMNCPRCGQPGLPKHQTTIPCEHCGYPCPEKRSEVELLATLNELSARRTHTEGCPDRHETLMQLEECERAWTNQREVGVDRSKISVDMRGKTQDGKWVVDKDLSGEKVVLSLLQGDGSGSEARLELEGADKLGSALVETASSMRQQLNQPDGLPNYSLGVVYFDESKRYRMPLKVERGRVWFVAPDVLDNGHGERRLHVTSIPESEFNEWASEAKFAEYVQFGKGKKARIWEGL